MYIAQSGVRTEKVRTSLSRVYVSAFKYVYCRYHPKRWFKITRHQTFANAVEIEMEEIMAFGDHYNDIEMLKGVGIGWPWGMLRSK